jgi:Uma2 family endonuclease
MATATLKRIPLIGPESNGIAMTPREFDRADFVEGWRYELVNGVLIVTSTPLPNERDPNQYLGYLLLFYQQTHPQGFNVDVTLPEQMVRTRKTRRRADRAIWIGLGRLPTIKDAPAVIAEFVSGGRRNWLRDYKLKRDEYMAIGVKQYWIIDRFAHTMTVFYLQGGKVRRRLFRKNQIFTTDLLPGFELPLSTLFALADRWPEEESPESS